MPDRKSAVKETGPVRKTLLLHSRRMEEVRKNFAVGLKRIVGDRIIKTEHGLKHGQENTA